MKKTYITEDSFGSMLPDNWEIAAAVMNEKIDALPDDADRDDLDAIWEAYCAGEYDAEIAEREAE